MKYNRKEIQNIIPHRYEMLLIDEVELLEEGKKAVGRVFLKDDTWFFKGHFPNEPVMPGVLQVEAAAQIGAVVLLAMEENEGKIGYFRGIDNVKFKRKVIPGDCLEIVLELVSMKSAIGKGKAVGSVNGEIAFKADLSFVVM